MLARLLVTIVVTSYLRYQHETDRGSRPEEIERYKVEPYVMSADIYAAAPHAGRGGWTWYTGAAGWMYRLSVELLLGLQLEGDHLRIAPCVPADWESYKIHYRYRDTFYHIDIKCGGEKSDHVMRVTVDGAVVNEIGLNPLLDDRQEHYVEMYLKGVG